VELVEEDVRFSLPGELHGHAGLAQISGLAQIASR